MVAPLARGRLRVVAPSARGRLRAGGLTGAAEDNKAGILAHGGLPDPRREVLDKLLGKKSSQHRPAGSHRMHMAHKTSGTQLRELPQLEVCPLYTTDVADE